MAPKGRPKRFAIDVHSHIRLMAVEELTVTVSTVVAIVSVVQRRFVSPVRGEGSPQKGSQFPRES